MWGETKRMFFNKNFLAAWLIACISIAIGQTYPSLKKHCMWYFYQYTGRFLKKSGSIFCHSGSGRIAWSDSILQEYKSGFLKEILPRTTRRQYIEGKFFPLWYLVLWSGRYLY